MHKCKCSDGGEKNKRAKECTVFNTISNYLQLPNPCGLKSVLIHHPYSIDLLSHVHTTASREYCMWSAGSISPTEAGVSTANDLPLTFFTAFEATLWKWILSLSSFFSFFFVSFVCLRWENVLVVTEGRGGEFPPTPILSACVLDPRSCELCCQINSWFSFFPAVSVHLKGFYFVCCCMMSGAISLWIVL